MTVAVGLPNRHHETGQRIRRLRLTTGLSQERFAPRIGISRRHMIRLENGEHRPSRELAARIERIVEEITGKPPRERIVDEEEEEPAPVMSLDEFLRRRVRELHRELLAEERV